MLKLLPILLIWLGTVSPLAGEPEAPVADAHRNITDNMVLITGGVFERGCDKFGPQHGAPVNKVYIGDFMIDKFEVTNEQFEKIIPEHRLRRSRFSKCGDCPVAKVTWYDATDFCYLTGKTLPTEAQWEKAAGAANGCEFPWGPQFDKDNPQAHGGLKLKDQASPVGQYPPNKYGIYDLAGNVWEWTADWFSIGSYKKDEILRNPLGSPEGGMKVRRGGSWPDSTISMTAGYRDWSPPFSRSLNDVGFRCVINLKTHDKSN